MKEDPKQSLLRALDPKTSKEEFAELMKDPILQREYFEIIRMKSLLSSLKPEDFTVAPKSFVIPWKRTGAFFLAAASILIVFGIFYFYKITNDSYKVAGNLKVSHGVCEQNESSDHWIGYQTKENSYCDLILEGMGTFSIRIFPNTRFITETSPNNLRINIQEGSILLSSVHKKEGIVVEANSPHIRSILLGTSLFITANKDKERIFLIEGSIQVEALGATEETKSILVKSGSIAETADWNETSKPDELRIQINSISAKEESILQTQFDSMKQIRESKDFIGYKTEDIKSIETVHEREKWSNRPYVQIMLKNGTVQEGYLIEIGDFYSIQTIDSGLIRMPKTSISEISTLRK
ncbi:hypothetical protein A0128_04585 [Leptospira tipperaryensis]|uniref:Iron dicitrate transport regulator FecR n=1 Tax=Leptospira tipperaryensis TaxID=2564040 RepID=A0A1D7UUF7_9LEPT|nr:hypothetical protein [Leptospira tipperaryensis]AOP33195.1 hypothetical protein A0128_04585 [Leptospira tipperaryensis]